MATFESGQGFCIYDDKTLSERTPNLGDGCDSSDYYPRFIRALYDFAKEISKEKKFRIHKVDVGDYYLLLFDTGETLWGFFCDFFDNIPFIETKIMKIIKLLDPVVRKADNTRPLKINNSLQQRLDAILATQVFPEDKLEEIDTLIQKLDKTEQVTITHIYLLDLDGGIVKAWEPSRDYIDFEARRKLFRLISGLPFQFQTRLELNVDVGSNEDEGWKILRLGNTEFAMCFRVLYATEHRALLNVITERVCERIIKLIGDDIQKVSTELSHWNSVEVQKEDLFDFDYKTI
ncbi:MAG: hypothetical protein ACFFCD_13775 [Promethearchaeota archaeon]